MTKEEAETVVAWCEKNELMRPSVAERKKECTLTWVSVFGGGNFTTATYQAARHWCRVMQIEHDHGVVGYWAK